MNDEIRCPKCNSKQISANKKGFSGTKAAAGALLTGGVGVLAGTIGQNDIEITCLACGHKWEPAKEQARKEAQKPASKTQKYAFLFFVVCIAIVIYLIASR